MNPPSSLIANSIITGGAFTLINNPHNIRSTLGALDRLLQAVSPSAFHNSGERYDPPRCLRGTRVAVMDRLEHWRLGLGDDASSPILWLSGAAGAGKSAVAQSWAESCHERGLLLASFFFGRTDPTRNHARCLVATIVYQIYALVSSPEQARILDAIEKDPLIFTRSLITQFTTLLIEPLRGLLQGGHFLRADSPRLIILDGLDECLDHNMQLDVLKAMVHVSQSFNAPFLIFIASRLEHDIESFFSTRIVTYVLTRVVLNDEYHPDADIAKFLWHEFADCQLSHPFMHLIPTGWPPANAVHQLVVKASGQFIYASAVIKYIKSPRRNPTISLDIILGLRPASNGAQPFAQLDALYTHILSNVENVDTVLKLLNFMLPHRPIPLCQSSDAAKLSSSRLTFMHVHGLESLFSMEPGAINILFCDLRPLMEVEADDREFTKFILKHASFHDFLCDNSRSTDYHIRAAHHTEFNFAICLDFLRKSHAGTSISALNGALKYLRKNIRNINSLETPALVKSLQSFSVPHWLTVATAEKRTVPAMTNDNIKRDTLKECRVISICACNDPEMFVDSFVDFVGEVKCSASAGALWHLSTAVDCIWHQLLLGARTLSIDLNDFRLALLSSSNGTVISLSDTTGAVLQWEAYTDEHKKPYIIPLEKAVVAYLSSSSHCSANFKRKIFAEAAQFCLDKMCAHPNSTGAPAVIPKRLRRRRICLPWKWHRRIIKEHVGDHKETPWMWLPQYGSHNSQRNYSLHVKRKEIIYLTNKAKAGTMLDVHHIRYQMDQYHFFLLLLPSLLEQAAKSANLLATCTHKRFTSMSQEFPQAMKKARHAMAEYVARWSD